MLCIKGIVECMSRLADVATQVVPKLGWGLYIVGKNPSSPPNPNSIILSLLLLRRTLLSTGEHGGGPSCVFTKFIFAETSPMFGGTFLIISGSAEGEGGEEDGVMAFHILLLRWPGSSSVIALTDI